MGVLSSELSVFTLAVITLERNYAITHAMHLNKRLSLKHAAYIMGAAWSFSILMAALPLLGVSDYRKFAVCLPFETEDAISAKQARPAGFHTAWHCCKQIVLIKEIILLKK